MWQHPRPRRFRQHSRQPVLPPSSCDNQKHLQTLSNTPFSPTENHCLTPGWQTGEEGGREDCLGRFSSRDMVDIIYTHIPSHNLVRRPHLTIREADKWIL